ncbi:MAG: hypothetical protein AAF208_08150 [Cyanobacteria bacterium P01_A01_bin.45]
MTLNNYNPNPNKYNPLFRLIFRVFKYFALMIFGFAFAAFLATIFGSSHVALSLFPPVFEFIWRFGVTLIAVAGGAIVIESFR